jgi:hypothetical protein
MMTMESTYQRKSEVSLDAERVLSGHLKEYQTVSTEIYARFDNQRQAFNYLVGVVGGLLMAYGAATAAEVHIPVYVFLFVPLLITPLAFIFFDNEIMIWSIIYYTRYHLRPEVQKLTMDDKVLELECRRFRYLIAGTRHIHRMLSYDRWALFLVPTAIAVGYAVTVFPDWRHDPIFMGLLALDGILSLLLLVTMVYAAKQQAVWSPGAVRESIA